MVKIKSKDYHDYVIKDGKFIGAFEEMYQNVNDPWYHGKAESVSYDIALYLISKYKICSKKGKILDIGCGKGAFTYRIKKRCPSVEISAVDISQTAIKKAKKKYGRLKIDFEVMDVQKEYKKIDKKFDLIIVSEILWYVLPNFAQILNNLKKNLKPKGYLLIKQAFYKPNEQKYGREIVSSPEDMFKILKYKIVEMIELNRFENPVAIVLFKK